MPIYEYQCSNCGHKLEELQRISEEPLTKCPHCGKDTLKRLIGGGAGLIFKGSGFYLTDYKKSPASDKSKGSANEKKTETKPDTKSTETKPAANKENKKS
jgi:putative FmdB family regulatory protein